MRVVVADTSQVFYLLSIGQIEMLPRLFTRIILPDAVYKELSHRTAPRFLSEWIVQCSSWVEVTLVEAIEDASLDNLGAGERAAITLSMSRHASPDYRF